MEINTDILHATHIKGVIIVIIYNIVQNVVTWYNKANIFHFHTKAKATAKSIGYGQYLRKDKSLQHEADWLDLM